MTMDFQYVNYLVREVAAAQSAVRELSVVKKLDAIRFKKSGNVVRKVVNFRAQLRAQKLTQAPFVIEDCCEEPLVNSYNVVCCVLPLYIVTPGH